MTQHRITSATFYTPGSDPTIPDNYVDPKALADLKRLAGIDTLGLLEKVDTSGAQSPVSGELGTSNAEYQRKNNIKPGSDEWFRLWFSREPLTGENPKPKK
jgi:hypothetical protein